MFRSTLFFSLLFLSIGLTAIYVYLIRYKLEDQLNYRTLVKASVELLSSKALEREPITQRRQGVQKDIWRTEGEERLHFRLKSETSDLCLCEKKGKMEAVEQLKEIACLIQEGVDLAMHTQRLRKLEAQEGTYSFPAHHFSAETVDLAFYKIGGVELPLSLEGEKPFLRGVAQKTTLSAQDKTPSFKAQFLKLRLDPTQEIR